jgi:hypothetical protein
MIRTRLVSVVVVALSSIAIAAFGQTKADPAKPATPAKPAAGAPAGGAPAKAATPATPAQPAPAEKAMPTPEQMAELMKPAPELANIDWLAGNWKCDSKMKDMTGADVTTKSTVKNKWDLDKHWMSSAFESKKTKTMPGMKGTGFMGWDSSQKKYFMGGVDNWGGMMAGTSSGPTNDAWVFDGNMSMMGMSAKTRMTFTKTGDKTMTTKMEMQQGKDWMVMGEDTCKK